MKEDNTPATKADVQSLLREELKPINERLDHLDERMNGLDQKLDAFRKETGEKLEDIHCQCAILVENSHIDLGGATRDADQMLREKHVSLETRIARLEEAVGLTAA